MCFQRLLTSVKEMVSLYLFFILLKESCLYSSILIFMLSSSYKTLHVRNVYLCISLKRSLFISVAVSCDTKWVAFYTTMGKQQWADLAERHSLIYRHQLVSWMKSYALDAHGFLVFNAEELEGPLVHTTDDLISTSTLSSPVPLLFIGHAGVF